MKKVIFIIPMYNAAPHIQDLVESLKEQTNENWEAVFIDDLSVIGPGSVNEIIKCAKRKLTVAFAYKKVFELNVENGKILHKREHTGGIDPRLLQPGSPLRKIGGSQLYGYSWFYKVLGYYYIQLSKVKEYCHTTKDRTIRQR